MKLFLLALALLAATAAPAFAKPCDDEVKQVQAALGSAQISDDERAQVADMAKQAAQLCAAGNDQESIDVSAEAKAILNID